MPKITGPFFSRRRSPGFSLAEVIVAMGIMTIIMVSSLAAFVQTRRLAAASVTQSCAVTIVQGYIEQLKNIPLQNFINADATDPQNNPRLTVSFELPTMKDQSATPITLWTTPSTVSVTSLTTTTPGTSPTGAVDNLQSFDMDSRNGSLATTWSASWPSANNYPTSTPNRTDLRMNFWVQITDLTPSSTPKCKAYGMLIVYTWQYNDGGRLRFFRDSVRSVRSAVQTF
jgi:Tfp pilus assembly protein PilV